MYVCTAFIDITNSDWIKKWTCIKVYQKNFLKSKEPLMIWRTRKTNLCSNMTYSQYTFLNEKTSLFIINSDLIIPISLESKKCDLNIHAIMRASHCKVMYRVLRTYVRLKEILWIYDGIFFFRFEFKLLWNSDFMLLSYSEIIIGIFFPFNSKKKNLATSS